MLGENCGNCRFWMKTGTDTDQTKGLCRRYPPDPISSDGGAKYTSQFPVMFESGWCGEHDAG